MEFLVRPLKMSPKTGKSNTIACLIYRTVSRLVVVVVVVVCMCVLCVCSPCVCVCVCVCGSASAAPLPGRPLHRHHGAAFLGISAPQTKNSPADHQAPADHHFTYPLASRKCRPIWCPTFFWSIRLPRKRPAYQKRTSRPKNAAADHR